MPEHHSGTPSTLSALESFLWHDFGTEPSDWTAWMDRVWPEHSAAAADSFAAALHLHGVLRSMQEGHSGGQKGKQPAVYAALNQLIETAGIRPRLDKAGTLSLAAAQAADPVARLLLIVLEALRSGRWQRFKLCREPTCRASYYDASKAAVKIWCSMETCGSRNKMRRYRAQQNVQT
jgi:predicted RNA-binding Zn ribbon-like protein